jgi:hypothetical protein
MIAKSCDLQGRLQDHPLEKLENDGFFAFMSMVSATGITYWPQFN